VGWCLIAAMQRGALSRPLTGLLSIGTGGKLMDELVKRLRHSANFAERGLIPPPSELREAADAIEQLSNAGSAYGRGWTLGYDAGREENKPRWIPVTERLPEEYKDVLCYYEYFRYGDYNCMFRTIDRGYYGNGRWGGEAGQGHKNKVLAWMPLPEPPKEE
jgi:hypothetical protein